MHDAGELVVLRECARRNLVYGSMSTLREKRYER